MIKSFVDKIFIQSQNTYTGIFTLDIFRNISFQPVSVVKIHFINGYIVFLLIVFVALFLAEFTGYLGHQVYTINRYLYYDLYDPISPYMELGYLILTGLCVFVTVKSLIKKIRYKLNADYIESNFVNDGIVRIASKSRVGLFDKNKNKVLLPSNYSSIEKFDDHHLLIGKDNKKGLYSLTYRRVIIPVLYDSISQFSNFVATATIQGIAHHYDVKGNKLR